MARVVSSFSPRVVPPYLSIGMLLGSTLAVGGQEAPVGAEAAPGVRSAEPARGEDRLVGNGEQVLADPPEGVPVELVPAPETNGQDGEVDAGDLFWKPPTVEEAQKALSNPETVSVSFPDAEILEVVHQLGSLYGLNLVVPESLKDAGTVSLELRHVTWMEIFDIVLQEAKPAHTYRIEGNLVRIEKAPLTLVGGDPEIAFLVAAAVAVFSLVANAFLFAALKRRRPVGESPLP